MSSSGERSGDHNRFPFRIYERDGSFYTLLIAPHMTATQICDLAKTKLYKNNPNVSLVLFEKAGANAVREVKGTEFPGDFSRNWKGKSEDLQYYLIVRVQRANMVSLSSSMATSSVSASSLPASSIATSAPPLSPRGGSNISAFVAVGPTPSSQQASFLGNSRVSHHPAAVAAAAGSSERVMFVRNTPQHMHGPNATSHFSPIPQAISSGDGTSSSATHTWRAPPQHHVLVGLATSLNRRMSVIQHTTGTSRPIHSPQPLRSPPRTTSPSYSTSPSKQLNGQSPVVESGPSSMDRVEMERRKIEAIQQQIEDIKRRNEIERLRIERVQQGRLEQEERERKMIEEQRKRYQEELERQHVQVRAVTPPPQPQAQAQQESPFSLPGQSLDEAAKTAKKQGSLWSAAAVPSGLTLDPNEGT